MPAWVDSQGGDGRREEAVWSPDKLVGCRQTASRYYNFRQQNHNETSI